MSIYKKTSKDLWDNKGVYDFAKTCSILNARQQVLKDEQKNVVKDSDILKNAVIDGLDVTSLNVGQHLDTMVHSDIMLVLFLCIYYNREAFFDTVIDVCEKKGECVVDKDSETLSLIMLRLYDKTQSKEYKEKMSTYVLKLLDKGVVSISAVTTQNSFSFNHSKAENREKIKDDILKLVINFEKSAISQNIKTVIKDKKNINKI